MHSLPLESCSWKKTKAKNTIQLEVGIHSLFLLYIAVYAISYTQYDTTGDSKRFCISDSYRCVGSVAISVTPYRLNRKNHQAAGQKRSNHKFVEYVFVHTCVCIQFEIICLREEKADWEGGELAVKEVLRESGGFERERREVVSRERERERERERSFRERERERGRFERERERSFRERERERSFRERERERERGGVVSREWERERGRFERVREGERLLVPRVSNERRWREQQLVGSCHVLSSHFSCSPNRVFGWAFMRVLLVRANAYTHRRAMRKRR